MKVDETTEKAAEHIPGRESMEIVPAGSRELEGPIASQAEMLGPDGEATDELARAREQLRRVQEDYIRAVRREATKADQSRKKLVRSAAFWAVILGGALLGWWLLQERSPHSLQRCAHPGAG